MRVVSKDRICRRGLSAMKNISHASTNDVVEVVEVIVVVEAIEVVEVIVVDIEPLPPHFGYPVQAVLFYSSQSFLCYLAFMNITKTINLDCTSQR